MHSSMFKAVVLYLGFLRCSLSAIAEECLTEESQDEVSLLQVGQADVQNRKINHAVSITPVLQTEDSRKGRYLLARVDPDPAETARGLIAKDEKSNHSAHVDIFDSSDGRGDNHDHSPVYAILRGILNNAHEKIHTASRFLANQAQELASRLKQLKPLTPAEKLNKKGNELVKFLEEWLLFLMYGMMVIFIIVLIVLVIITCGLLVSWRVQVIDEEYQRERAAEDAVAASRSPSPVARVPQTGIHHRPFQGAASRLPPDDEDQK
jgi:hypothetical protein